MTAMRRVALYLRVSTDGQTTENQRRVLEEVSARRGWTVTAVYEDAGISGAKAGSKRPGFDAMLKDAKRRRFDVLAFWSVDRLGRSTATVAAALEELDTAGVTIYADKEAVDATTPHGRAMLEMAAVFAKLERSMIVERVKAGLARAKAETPAQRREKGKKAHGRPKVPESVLAKVRAALTEGMSIRKAAAVAKVSFGTAQKIAAEAATSAI
jgi:DNA invertase Pin-like site-specific DNA recombinase